MKVAISFIGTNRYLDYLDFSAVGFLHIGGELSFRAIGNISQLRCYVLSATP